MISYIGKSFRGHPLASVLIVAIIPRLIAVIYSKGFIYLDDHYDTIMVAYRWAADGMWGSDGLMTWKGHDASTIYRFPLYNLILYGIIRAHQMVGIESLNTMMYTIRALHAAVSLLPVWAAYAICQMVTKKREWAITGGLVIALHGALPFLGVRNLIEMVGGSLWLVALMYLYRYQENSLTKWVYYAGLITGLAWMVRFQIAFAAVPIPFVLWWMRKGMRPAIHYSVAVLAMLLLSGLGDWYFLGEFARSSLFLLSEGAGAGPLYNTIPLLFIAVLLILLIPPISGLLYYTIGRPSFWRGQPLLFYSLIVFIVIHSLLRNQQERFILPILPAVLVLAVLSLHSWSDGSLSGLWRRPLFRRLAIPALVLNLLLLLLLTPAYGRKGMIEPFVQLRQEDPAASILVIQPGLRYFMPVSYFGSDAHRLWVREWKDMAELRERYASGERFDYVILYPPMEDKLEAYRDSASTVVGSLTLDFRVKASTYDWIAHTLNPRHNHSFAAWVYRPETK